MPDLKSENARMRKALEELRVRHMVCSCPMCGLDPDRINDHIDEALGLKDRTYKGRDIQSVIFDDPLARENLIERPK